MSQRISIFDLTKEWKIESKIKLEKELRKFMLKNKLSEEEFFLILKMEFDL